MNHKLFTKGTWEIADDHTQGNNNNFTVLADMHIIICGVMRHNFSTVGKDKFKDKNTLHSCSEAEANAHLIAAAPDLLDACEQTRLKLLNKFGVLGGGNEINEIFELINKAVDKAYNSTSE